MGIIRTILIASIVSLFTISQVYAQGHGLKGIHGGAAFGIGHGIGRGVVPSLNGTLPAAHPPGLSSKPYGLMQRGITPSGWTKGKKVGWSCSRASGHELCVDQFHHNHTCFNVNGNFFCRP